MNSACTRGNRSLASLFKEKEATVLWELHWEHHTGQTSMVGQGGRSEQREKGLDWRRCRWQYVPEGRELPPFPARSPSVWERTRHTLRAGVAAALVTVTQGVPRSSSRGAAGLGSGRPHQRGCG